METYKGVIIEESLENKDIFKEIKITSTEIEKVTEQHKTPELTQWTLHHIEIPESTALDIANKISRLIKDGWYADFKDNVHHFIIFRNKLFFVDRKNINQYDEATKYGISVGIPTDQVDFSSEVIL